MARTEIIKTMRGREFGMSKDGWLVINHPDKSQLVVSPTGLLYTTPGGSTSTIGGGASLSVVNLFTKNQSVTPVALTDAATIATDASLSNNFTVTLTGNHTLGAPTNPTDGMVCNWSINTGAGSFTLAYNAVFDFGGAGTPTITTAASKVALLSGYYDNGSSKWLVSFRNGA